MTFLARRRSLSMLLNIGAIYVSLATNNTQDADGTCQDGNIASSGGTCVATAEMINGAPSASASTPQCGLYLAESTIPGAGLGIFTTTEKQPGDTVGSGDVCLPNIGIDWHNENPVFDPFEDYYWKGRGMGMGREEENLDIEAYCPGIDCAVNCNLALINVQKSTTFYDTGGLHRSEDPGVGAFTPYHNGASKVSRHIPVGGELFKFYGDNWFVSRSSIFDESFPLSEDYPAAEALLETLSQLDASHRVLEDVYDIITSFKAEDSWMSRILGAMPDTLEDALTAANAGELAILHQPVAIRSPEWLHENGRCIDNIQPGFSTFPQAGHGAFAVRDLAAGQLITTSPLHHLPNKDFVNMYKREAGDQWLRDMDEVSGHQILLNYCYSHAETSLLLCPYGNGVNYLNHNQTQANVRIRWAVDFPLAHNERALEKPVKDLGWDYKPQLGFDYVALRNIEEGEELFLDYGDSWEGDWLEHVDDFSEAAAKDEVGARYASGEYLNQQHANMLVRTMDEQIFDPYPDYFQTRCHPTLRRKEAQEAPYYWRANEYGYLCRIVDRHLQDNVYWYVVRLEIHPDDDDDETRKGVTWIERADVPRSGIHFFDKPGHTDMHLPNAFRHSLGIPDAMIPDVWRNLA